MNFIHHDIAYKQSFISSGKISQQMAIINNLEKGQRLIPETGQGNYLHDQSNLQIQFGYAPDTDAILILIQIQLSDTVQIRSRHICHFDTHSDSTF